jgi:hypothetical protein
LVEDQPFVDDGMVNIKAMEEAMRNSKEKTGSSCPNIYQWQEALKVLTVFLQLQLHPLCRSV